MVYILYRRNMCQTCSTCMYVDACVCCMSVCMSMCMYIYIYMYAGAISENTGSKGEAKKNGPGKRGSGGIGEATIQTCVYVHCLMTPITNAATSMP